MASILLVAMGSHGDINPLIGLGIALRDRGHSATLIASEHFEPNARAAGLEFARATTEQEFLEFQEFQELITRPNILYRGKGIEMGLRYGLGFMRESYRRIEELHSPGATVVVGLRWVCSIILAQEKLAIPAVTLALNPIVFRSVYSPAKLPGLSLPEWTSPRAADVVYRLIDLLWDQYLNRPANALRAELGLAKVKSAVHWVRSATRHIIGLWPEWFYGPQPDWPPGAALTNFIDYDGVGSDQETATALSLVRNERPIVFTAGSAMVNQDDFFAAAADSCRLLNRSGILLTPYTEQLPRQLPPKVKHLAYVPLGKLLPSAAAIVHHGGIGTAARALKAGVPQLIMPWGWDQFDNAYRLEKLGVAKSIARRKFKAARIAPLLNELLDSKTIAERCRDCSERLSETDGLARTCELVESVLERSAAA